MDQTRTVSPALGGIWHTRFREHRDGGLHILMVLLALKQGAVGRGPGPGTSDSVAAIWGRVLTPQASEQELDQACAELEWVYPHLRGVFQHLSLSLDRSSVDVMRLSELARQVDQLAPHDDPLWVASNLGSALAALMDEATGGSRAEEPHVPRGLADLMVRLLDLKGVSSVCDLEVRDGALLAACLRWSDAGSPSEGRAPPALWGHALRPSLRAFSKLYLHLCGAPSASIEQGDVLHVPRSAQGDELKVFPRVLLHPPLRRQPWASGSPSQDPFHRFAIGVPAWTDMAYLLHALAILEPEGRAVALVPHGLLSRQDADGEIRRELIRRGVVETVLSLPPRVLAGTVMPVAIMTIRAQRAGWIESPGEVYFVAGERLLGSSREWDGSGGEQLEMLGELVASGREEPGRARRVSISEIADNGYSLVVNRYVATPTNRGEDLDEQLASLRHLERARDEANARMDSLLHMVDPSSLLEDPLQSPRESDQEGSGHA